MLAFSVVAVIPLGAWVMVHFLGSRFEIEVVQEV
jgi:hypothetical protein